MNQRCRVCGNDSGNEHFYPREMMYGTREEFAYFQCGGCGCIQIQSPPSDLSRYYPQDYYSLSGKAADEPNRLKRYLKIKRARYLLSGKGWLGLIISRMVKTPAYYDWLKRAQVTQETEILEVGCGLGGDLICLSNDGFHHLTGIDPFLSKSIYYPNGVKVLRMDIHNITGEYDFIMMNHSFEHMAEPLQAMVRSHELLRPGGSLLIRTPVASSFAWREYGVDWVQIDAPRHLFIHSVKSLRVLADKAGFEVSDIVFDSNEFQFWGSEQYKAGMALNAPGSYATERQKSSFTKNDILKWRRRAEELNIQGLGDQACFYLLRQ